MLMDVLGRPQSERCGAGPSRCYKRPAPSESATSTAGCGIEPIRMPTIAPWRLLFGMLRLACLQTKPSPRPTTCWSPSAKPALNVRPTARRLQRSAAGPPPPSIWRPMSAMAF
jgi:hypothetical protein